MPGKVKKVDFSRKGKWLSLLFIAFMLYFSVIMINQQLTLRNLSQRQQEIQAEITQYELENSLLYQQIELLQTNPDYIEGIARQELGLVREGETVYILPKWDIDK